MPQAKKEAKDEAKGKFKFRTKFDDEESLKRERAARDAKTRWRDTTQRGVLCCVAYLEVYACVVQEHDHGGALACHG